MLHDESLIAALDAGGPPTKNIGVEWFRRTGFHQIRDYLENGTRHAVHNGKTIDVLQAAVEPLDDAIEKATRLLEPAILWRGTTTELFLRHSGFDFKQRGQLVGEAIPEPCYVSTSVLKDEARGHVRPTPLLLRIEVPPGTPLLWIAWQSRVASEDVADDV